MTTFRTTAPDDGLPEVRMPTHRRPGHTIVALHGALDAAAAPALREHLVSALRRSGRLLILDLGEVSVCDTAGLAVLVGAQRRAAALGITVQLAAPGAQILGLLHVTGLGRSFIVQAAPHARAESAA